MKKLLLATTASAVAVMVAASGPAMAGKKAQKIKLSVGGYMEQWIGYVDDDRDDKANQGTPNLDQKADSEIHFKGSTTLDNGLKFGVKWELEGDDKNVSSASAYDEAMLYVSGSFGRINLGQEDGAAELMQFGAPAVGPIGVNKSDASDFVAEPAGFGSILNTHQLDIGTADNHKITYTTPRVSGLQVGASYVPQNDNENDAQQDEDAVGHNYFSVGVNFKKKVGKTNFKIAVGYAVGEDTDLETGVGKEPEGWSVGGSASFGGITIGAAHLTEDNVGASLTADTAREHNQIGASYAVGKDSFSLSYGHNKSNGVTTTAGDDEYEILTLGYKRNLGPGVDFMGSLARIDWDGEDGTTTTDDNGGWAAVAGIKLSF